MLINQKDFNWSKFHTLIFDFDGVFTNNKVYVNEKGIESIIGDRGDGLGLNILQKFINLKKWDLDYFILSKESNTVVKTRAKKLNIKCINSVDNKLDYLINYLNKNNKSAEGLLYVGNDLNDLGSIKLAGFGICPLDAHPIIKKNCDLIFPRKGGDGFVRGIIELIIGLEEMDVKEIMELI